MNKMVHTFENILDVAIDKIIKRIQSSDGLSGFAEKRAKFEGWLKVELIDIFLKEGFKASPEVEHVDIVINENIGIELKTVNTNYRNEKVKNATRPITRNVESVLKDIQKLKNKNFTRKFVVFITFPVEHENKKWEKHLNRITSYLASYKHKQFLFKRDIPGVIYLGEVK
jgi:hypothetical protein